MITPELRLRLESVFRDDPGDGSLICGFLGELAKEYGYTKLAQKSGLGRESLYKALSGKNTPQFKTILKVLNAFDFELTVKPTVSKL